MGLKRYRGSIISKSIALIIHALQTTLRSILKAKSHSTNMQSMLDFVWKQLPLPLMQLFPFLLTHLSKCFNQLVLWHRALAPLWCVRTTVLSANKNLMDLSGKIKIKMTMWLIGQSWEEQWWSASETKSNDENRTYRCSPHHPSLRRLCTQTGTLAGTVRTSVLQQKDLGNQRVRASQ